MKRFNYVIIILFLFLLTGCFQEKNLHLLNENVVIELGEEINLYATYYLDESKIKPSRLEEIKELKITMDVGDEDYKTYNEQRYIKPGQYPVSIQYHKEKVTFNIEIKDTTQPRVIGPSSIQLAKGDSLDYGSYYSVNDLNEIEPLNFDESHIQKEVIGDYSLFIQALDKAGNETKLEVPVQVVDRNEKDQIEYYQQDNQVRVSSMSSLVKMDEAGNKSIMLDVPFYNQFAIGAPVGCEAVSLYMALSYQGNAQDKDVISFISTTPRSPDDNPYHGFVGTVFDQHRYDILPAIFPSALTPWANQYGKAVDISGQGAEAVVNQLMQGNPVVIWITAYFNEPEWQYFDWGKGFKNTHTVCAIGYDEASKTLYYHDPGMGSTKAVGFDTFKYIYEIQNFGVSIL